MRKFEFRIRVSGSFFNHEAHPVRQSQLNEIDTKARSLISYPVIHCVRCICHKTLKLCDNLFYYFFEKISKWHWKLKIATFYWHFFIQSVLHLLQTLRQFRINFPLMNVKCRHFWEIKFNGKKTLLFIYNAKFYKCLKYRKLITCDICIYIYIYKMNFFQHFIWRNTRCIIADRKHSLGHPVYTQMLTDNMVPRRALLQSLLFYRIANNDTACFPTIVSMQNPTMITRKHYASMKGVWKTHMAICLFYDNNWIAKRENRWKMRFINLLFKI